MANNNSVEKEVFFGILPVLRGERQLGMFDFILIQIGFGVAAWSFLVGGYTGSTLGAEQSIAAILFGNALPVLLICGLAVVFARYGVDTFLGARATLGPKGSDIFFSIFSVLNLGWITMACFMLGESAIKVMGSFGFEGFLTERTSGAPMFAILSFVVAWFLALGGPLVIKWFIRVGVPAMMLIIMGLIYYVVKETGLTEVMNAEPRAAYDDAARSLASGIEWNVGLGFSWLPYIGAWSRLVKTENTGMLGTFLGWGVLLNVAAILGALVALLIGSNEPTEWMIEAGGPIFGLFGLFLLILANLTSAVVLIYTQGISVKTMFPKWNWKAALLTTVPAVLLMLTPAAYDGYLTFLGYVSFVMAAFGGVLVTDLLFMKRGILHLNDLYDNNGGRYRYIGGINWAAYFAVFAGGVFYFIMYDPVSDTATELFSYISAGIPTFFFSSVVYFFASKLKILVGKTVVTEKAEI